MQAKENKVKVYSFCKPSLSHKAEYQLNQKIVYPFVIRNAVEKVGFCQSIKKMPGSKIDNFWVLSIIRN